MAKAKTSEQSKKASSAEAKTKRAATSTKGTAKPKAAGAPKAAPKAAGKPAKPLSNAQLMEIAKAEASRVVTPKVAKTADAAKKPRATKKSAPAEPSTRDNALAAAQAAIERKAENVRLLELKDVTSITDYFVVCSADTDRQVKAIAENVIVEMRDKRGQQPWRSEGWDTMNWIIIDFVDFVVHVLQSETRQFYNIERLWADAPSELIEDTAAKPKRATKKKSGTDDGDDSSQTTRRSKIRVIEDIDAE